MTVSTRTKNRIAEHAAHWMFIRTRETGIQASAYPECRDQPLAHFFCEADKLSDNCRWQGWLPVAELTEAFGSADPSTWYNLEERARRLDELT